MQQRWQSNFSGMYHDFLHSALSTTLVIQCCNGTHSSSHTPTHAIIIRYVPSLYCTLPSSPFPLFSLLSPSPPPPLPLPPLTLSPSPLSPLDLRRSLSKLGRPYDKSSLAHQVPSGHCREENRINCQEISFVASS